MQNNIGPCFYMPFAPGCGDSSGGSTISTTTIAACNVTNTNTAIPVGKILSIFNPNTYLSNFDSNLGKVEVTQAANAAGLDLPTYLIINFLAEGAIYDFSSAFSSAKYLDALQRNSTNYTTNATALKYIVGSGTTVYDPNYPPCSSAVLAMTCDFFNNFAANMTAFEAAYGSLAKAYTIVLSSTLSSTAIPNEWLGGLIKFLATSVANYNAGVAIGDINGTTGYASKTTLDFIVDTTSAISLGNIANVGTIKLSFQAANTFNMANVDATLAKLIFYSTIASPTITNLNNSPAIEFNDISGTVSPTITYALGVLSSPTTLSLTFNDAIITTLTINKATAETNVLFNKVKIISKCADTDIPNTISTFASTALSLETIEIDASSTCGLTLPFGTAMNSIASVSYTGNAINMPFIITFASTTVGIQGAPVTMVVPQGSTIGFARTDKLDINDGTSVTFTGGNGTLQIVTAAFPTASVTSKYSGVTGLITTTAFTAGTWDMSLIAGSTGLKTLTATATASFIATAFLTNLADTFTLNIGTLATRIDTTGMMLSGTKFTAVSGCSSCIMNLNMYPDADADVLTNTFSLVSFKTLNLNISSGDSTGIAASTITLLSGGVVNTINLTGSGTALATAVALTLTVTAGTSLATLDASGLGDINVGLTYTVTSTGLTTLKGSTIAANVLTGHASVATTLTITGGTAADTFTSGVGGGAWTISGKGGADTFKITSTTTGTLMTITDFNPGTSSTAIDKLNIQYGVSTLLGLGYLITGASTAADVAAAGGFTFTSTSSTTATITAGTNGAAFVYTGGTLTTSSTVSGFSIGAADTGCVGLVYKSADDGFVHVGLLYYSAATTASSLTDVFILQNVTDVTLIDATDLLSIA